MTVVRIRVVVTLSILSLYDQKGGWLTLSLLWDAFL